MRMISNTDLSLFATLQSHCAVVVELNDSK